MTSFRHAKKTRKRTKNLEKVKKAIDKKKKAKKGKEFSEINLKHFIFRRQKQGMQSVRDSVSVRSTAIRGQTLRNVGGQEGRSIRGLSLGLTSKRKNPEYAWFPILDLEAAFQDREKVRILWIGTFLRVLVLQDFLVQIIDLRIQVRLARIGLCARLIGIHRLHTLGFYSYLHRYLQPKQRDVRFTFSIQYCTIRMLFFFLQLHVFFLVQLCILGHSNSPLCSPSLPRIDSSRHSRATRPCHRQQFRYWQVLFISYKGSYQCATHESNPVLQDKSIRVPSSWVSDPKVLSMYPVSIICTEVGFFPLHCKH